ncbi:cobalamin-binding protein [Larkinella knui]|uniref:Cobalamin-binding protein n=1 Tax=Larkinella knui TaxID=2025310 RepID=A0A3P1CYN1_9BACT|nr:cobalamin-binding protein [Larkinella knui]
MPPRRIISVVPSQTELLFELGLEAEIVGITKFCVHPAEKVKNKPKVGGTKTLHLAEIHRLKPDFILANKEENTREQIEELQRFYPVLVTDVNTVSDALAMIRDVGERVGKAQKGAALVKKIEESFYKNGAASAHTVAYFIWRKPYRVAARQTFIHSMLEMAGFQNAFGNLTRYPEVTETDLQTARPDLIFLSSEPYPFSEKHRHELQEICPSARVVLVDGELFSWYGSRLLKVADYLKELKQKLGLQ